MERISIVGIGLIIFRSEEYILQGSGQIEFYDNVIAPYKGLCESRYVSNYSLKKLLFANLYHCLDGFPRTQIVSRLKNLPIPPRELKNLVNYP